MEREATNVSCDHPGFGFYKDADLYIVVIWPAAGGTPTAMTAQSNGAAADHPRAAYYSVLYGKTIGPLSYFVPHQTTLKVKPIIFNKWFRELKFVNPTAVFVVNEGSHGTVFTICVMLKPPGCCMM